MTKITKEQLAETLNSNQYGKEITIEQEKLAKENGLVVVFGSSDDLCEFRGAIDNEIGCYDGRKIKFDKEGDEIDEDDMDVLQRHKAVPNLNTIEAVWFDGTLNCPWSYQTEIPHSTFKIMEDDELYCVGIIFDVADLV